MPFFQYYCLACKEEFDKRLYVMDNKWYDSDTDEFLSDEFPPEDCKCPECFNLSFRVVEVPEGIVRGFSDRNRRRGMRFNEYGMEKEQAEAFYKDAIAASKDRMDTMGEVYKKVSPNMEYFTKKGLAKGVDDKRKIEKIEASKKMAQERMKRSGK